ncbi:hypothetical protein EVAR_67055_1 [Eumeta japonica]|uniref:Uncharacterized protein n=1 Tax=Eumeta variegata TaxID=151549 RepID=A0A4C1ZJA5_EUMVA|nr:hypothetical protein EVAR_67055_1 [Eumeta japonica]
MARRPAGRARPEYCARFEATETCYERLDRCRSTAILTVAKCMDGLSISETGIANDKPTPQNQTSVEDGSARAQRGPGRAEACLLFRPRAPPEKAPIPLFKRFSANGAHRRPHILMAC